MLDRDALLEWTKCYLPAQLLDGDIKLDPVSGDAGFREYFRINSTPPVVVAYAPPKTENNESFVAIGMVLSDAGVHVPRIYAVDYQQGFLIQEDLGVELFMDSLAGHSAELLYGNAQATLLKIQRADRAIFPQYSPGKLLEEMELFPYWFVNRLLDQQMPVSVQQMFDGLFSTLVDNAVAQPQVVVHRDFHSRNLLVQPDGDIGVIDYQDAVVGPCTYDLVSLLRDCYVRWPTVWVKRRMLDVFYDSRATGCIAKEISEEQYERWFDLMGLQRHIKVLGIFSRLWLRDQKSAYLADLPLVIRYTLEVARRYPETRELYEWFVSEMTEPLSHQHWYQDWRIAGDL
jgi:hypothetical protein